MTTFADALIALGQHMNLRPDLETPSSVSFRYYRHLDGYRDGLELVLSVMTPIERLVGWASSLTDVASDATRYEADHALHAHVYGQMDGVPVYVWARVPGEGFPDEVGDHEWDVTTLLQEA